MSVLAALVEAGCDFVVIPAAGRIATTPQEEKVGRILQVESSMDDGLLRAANDLPVDAVLVTDTFEGSGPLVWHQLMIFQHLARLISKPLIVSIPADVNGEELKALWEAGVVFDEVRAAQQTTGCAAILLWEATLLARVFSLPRPQGVAWESAAQLQAAQVLPTLPPLWRVSGAI